MNYISVLTSLDDMKAMDINTSQTSQDNALRRYIYEASSFFENIAGRMFSPRVQTKYYDYPYRQTSVLKLGDDLLELIEVKTRGGQVTMDNSKLFLKCGYDYNAQPYDQIHVDLSSSNPFFEIGQTSQKSSSVRAVWGYHHEYENAWINTNDTVVSATNTSIIVNNSDGLNEKFDTRFKKMQIIKVVQGANFEFCLVIDLDNATNTLSVQRAINGTSQLTLTGSETIYSWQPLAEVEHSVRRLAVFYARQKSSGNQDSDRAYVTSTGLILPSNLPKEITQHAISFRNGFR